MGSHEGPPVDRGTAQGEAAATLRCRTQHGKGLRRPDAQADAAVLVEVLLDELSEEVEVDVVELDVVELEESELLGEPDDDDESLLVEDVVIDDFDPRLSFL